jgi:hypothetical protein
MEAVTLPIQSMPLQVESEPAEVEEARLLPAL